MAARPAVDASFEGQGPTLPQRVTGFMRRGTGRRAVPANDPALKLGYLRHVDILAPLSPDEHQWVADNTTMVTCPCGRIFYTPDDAGEVIFLLKQGRVSLYRLTPEGRKLTIATLAAGACFGEMGLLGPACTAATPRPRPTASSAS